MALYPNPSNTGISNVLITSAKASNGTVTVRNALGQIVYTKQASLNEGATTLQVDLSAYSDGIYTVSVTTNSGSFVKKLTVTK
jgi:hypothetical protein